MELKQNGTARPVGTVTLRRTRDLGDLVHRAPPGWSLKNWLRYRRREVPTLMLGRVFGLVTFAPKLSGQVYRAPWADLDVFQTRRLRDLLAVNTPLHELAAAFGGHVTNYGVLSRRVVTTAGVNFMVDAFQNTTELENLKFHAFGTGTNAEASADTALQTELTTQYNPDSTRPTGSLTEGASANIFRTVGTLTPDAGGTIAVTEHGVMSQAATGGGTLLDRSVFSAVNIVASADSLQTTYDLTLTAGG